MHVAVAGNIGSGKTTLTAMLARHYGWTPMYETVRENPYLEDYYGDIRRWSFCMEVFYLKERFRQALEIRRSGADVVQDRSLFEGAQVFAAHNHRAGHLSDRDYATYADLFSILAERAGTPDLMVYLRAGVPHLARNIQRRGREAERAIRLDYLGGLNELYEDFIGREYKGRVLTVEVDGMDFLRRAEDFRSITSAIDALLYGLFPPGGDDTKHTTPCT